MKKKLFLATSVLFGTTVFAQVGINTTTPNAQLDIRATSATAPTNTDGLLIPKVNVFPATNPTAAQQGMLLYLTTTSGSNAPGFYYWDNPTTSWIGLGKDGKAWQLAGNTVNAATDFMGSTNDADVVFKRNNVRAGLLNSFNASFGVNALNPAQTGSYNTALGSNVLGTNTTGYWNTGIGGQSLITNTTGYSNTGIGAASLAWNIQGNNNTAAGLRSLLNNTTGNFNTTIGSESLVNNTTGSNNTGLGYLTQTGANLTNATAIGSNASATTSNSLVLGSINGTNGATASTKVGIGTTAPNALLEVKALNPAAPANTEGLLIPRVSVFPAANPTAAQHGMQVFLTATVGTNTPGFYYWNNPTTSWVGIGGNATGNNWALAGNTVNVTTDFVGSTNDADVVFRRNNVRAGRLGVTNTSFGMSALNPANTGVWNTASGVNSLMSNTDGSRNTAIGSYALHVNTTGYNNTSFGCDALENNTSGYQNTALGFGAFLSAANYYNSTALGAYADVSASNQVRLGNNAVNSIGGQVGWTTVSDVRFKTENAQKVPGIDFIKKLRPVTYYINHEAMNTYLNVGKENGDQNNGDKAPSSGSNAYKPTYTKTLETGFMAQEVEQAAKELGYEFNGVDAPKNDKDFYGLRYAQFVVPLVKAVQELNEKIEAKEKENKLLENRLLELERRLSALEQKQSN